jgi:hypothetical protein
MPRVIVRLHQRNNRATQSEHDATAVKRTGFAGFSRFFSRWEQSNGFAKA